MAMQWRGISPSFLEMLTKANLSYLTRDKWWSNTNNPPDHNNIVVKKKGNARKRDGIPCRTKHHHHNDFMIKIRGGELKANFGSQVGTIGFFCILEESFEKTLNKKVL